MKPAEPNEICTSNNRPTGSMQLVDTFHDISTECHLELAAYQPTLWESEDRRRGRLRRCSGIKCDGPRQNRCQSNSTEAVAK